MPAAVGSRAGRQVRIWVNDVGQLVYPPIGQGQIASRVIAVVALTPALLAVLLLGSGLADPAAAGPPADG